MDRQNQPTPSVFDKIGTSYQQSPVPAPSKDRTRQKDYLRPAQCSEMVEQPKKEIPINMPINEKTLATIIEGRWYSVGKVVLPKTSSARTGKNPEVAPQAEQTLRQPQELMKTDSLVRPSIHPPLPSVNQLKPPQVQVESKPILVEGQEDWTEEYEEEQLDYEPSADDQIGLLETGEQEDCS
ncbi:unnamed protein product [Prunus armeniaca]